MANRKEMLEQVNAAITAILTGGQSYRIGSRSLNRADLSALRSLRDDLEAQVEEEAQADAEVALFRGVSVAYFDGR